MIHLAVEYQAPGIILFGIICSAAGFYLGWTLKPQTKTVAGSVRGAHGKFVKRGSNG